MSNAVRDLRSVFRDQLDRAVYDGRMPLTRLGLGPATLAALAIVALKHPHATGSEIAVAYDAFNREHRRRHSHPVSEPGGGRRGVH